MKLNLYAASLAVALIAIASAITEMTTIAAAQKPTQVPVGKIVASISFDPKVDGFGFANWGNERDGRRDLGAGDLIRMFGTKAVCKNPGATPANCVVKASARGWMNENLEAMNGGHCEGMAVACLRMKNGQPFKGRALPAEFQPAARSIFGLRLDAAMANYIAYYWATQSFLEISDINADYENKGPLNVVNALIQGMNAGNDSYTIGICQREKTGCERGHAVTPFAVEDMGTYYRIHIYDNNDPGLTRYMTVLKSATQKWNYVASTNPNEASENYTGDIRSKSLSLTPTSAREGRCFAPPFDESMAATPGCGIERPAARPAENAAAGAAPVARPATPSLTPRPIISAAPRRYADLFLTGDGDMLVLDGKDRRLGYDPDEDDYFDEIPGARMSTLIGGKGVDLPFYRVPHDPKGEPYVIVFSGANVKKQSVMDFVYSGPGFTVGFDEIRLDPDEYLVAAISPDGERIAMEMTSDGQLPSVYYYADTGGRSYMAEIVPNIAPVKDLKRLPNNLKGARGFRTSFEREEEAIGDGDTPQMLVDFVGFRKLQVSDNVPGDSGYNVTIEQYDISGKRQRIRLKDVGAGNGGKDAFEINVAGWKGGDTIGVKTDINGNGFADDDEEPYADEDNGFDYEFWDDEDEGAASVAAYLYPTIRW